MKCNFGLLISILSLVASAAFARDHFSNADAAVRLTSNGFMQSTNESGDALNCKQTDRKVEFSASQLTIENLDVSSDGRHVVFDMLGDLYVVPVTGGDAIPLTRGKGWDVRPVWSPDGRYVAFISDRLGSDQVFVIDSKGEEPARQLTSGKGLLTNGPEGVIGAVEWMPDSTAVMANGTLLFINSSKPIHVEIRDDEHARNRAHGLYHGNGADIYNFRYQVNADAPTEIGGYSLWKFETTSGEWINLRESVPLIPSFETPVLSRDGRWLVYKNRVRSENLTKPSSTPNDVAPYAKVVQVYDRRTGATRVLLEPGHASGWRSIGDSFTTIGRLSITPDSQFLVAAYGGRLHKIDLETGGSELIPITVVVRKCLDPIAKPAITIGGRSVFDVKSFRDTTLRPDGAQMAFSALRRLYVSNPVDAKPRRLVDQNLGQFHPSYSPDGRWIAYASWSETDGGHLWRVPSSGGIPERLTQQAGYYQTPVWSPDGESIAFVGSNEISGKRSGMIENVHGGTLQLLSLRNGVIRRFPVEARFGHFPSFSKDGERIWFAAYTPRELGLKLHSVGVDGGRISEEEVSQRLSANVGEQAVPSPDGRYVALTRHGNLYLVHCNQSIGSTIFNAYSCFEFQVTSDGAYDVRWRANGNELEWAFAEMHYRSRIDDLIAWSKLDNRREVSPPIVESMAAHLNAPQAKGWGTVILSGARIITMRGDEVIENGSVRISDGVITQVGRADELEVPEGVTVINLQGKTVLPGFIDAHAHLFDLPRDLLDANNGEALNYLAFGITTAKDPAIGGDHFFSYTELIKAGDMVGPRLFGAEALDDHGKQTISSLDDAIGISRRTRRLGGTYLKYHTGWDRQQRRWIIEAARENNLGVAAHWPASNYVAGRLNLSTIIDGATSSEHALGDNQDLSADYVDFIVCSGVSINFASVANDGRYPLRYWESIRNDQRMQRFFVGRRPPEHSLPLPQWDANGLPALASAAERGARLIGEIDGRGGNVALGSHGNFGGVGFHLEMWAHVRGGMPPHSVLRAATVGGARATGVERELGSIEVGKLADLIILESDPLGDIRNTLSVERVMQGGILRDAMTLDEIWPVKTPLPPWRMKDGTANADEVQSDSLH